MGLLAGIVAATPVSEEPVVVGEFSCVAFAAVGHTGCTVLFAEESTGLLAPAGSSTEIGPDEPGVITRPPGTSSSGIEPGSLPLCGFMMSICRESSRSRDTVSWGRLLRRAEPLGARATLAGSAATRTADCLEPAEPGSSAGGNGFGPSSSAAVGDGLPTGRETEVESSLGSPELPFSGAALAAPVWRGFQPPRTGADELSVVARDNCTFRRTGSDAASGAGNSRSSELIAP